MLIVQTGDDARLFLAAALLFTTPPTDRALAGWHGAHWASEELAALGVPEAAREAVTPCP